MKIIGITGTNGSGKGEVVKYLKQKGFVHFSVRNFLMNEIEKRNLPLNRTTMNFLANELRKENSPSYIIENLLIEAKIQNEDCIIESIRTPGEVEFLKQQGSFYLIAIDADPRIRFERIKTRKTEFDDVTFQEFISEEEMEMKSTDPNKQNIVACMSAAHLTLTNNGTTEELHKALDAVIPDILKTSL